MEQRQEQRKKGILLVVPVYASYHCFLRELACALVEAGWDVCVACDLSATMGQEHDEAEKERIRFFDLPFPRGANPIAHFKAAGRLRRIIREVRPALIHAHFSAAIVTTALSIRRSDSAVAIGTFQGLQFPLAEGLKKWIYRRAEIFAGKRLAGVWVLTHDDREALRRAGVNQAYLQKSFGFGCPVDHFDQEKYSAEARRSIRQQYGIPSGATVFTFVGRNVAFKGFHLVVQAFLRLLESRPDARFLIVGDRDPFHPTGLTPESEEQMYHTSEIIRCGWQKDVVPFLAVSDFLVHPSTREGMPVGCMEALAMGLPLIAPDARGMRELLTLMKQKPLRELSEDALVSAMKEAFDRDDSTGDGESFREIRAILDRKNYLSEQLEIYLSLVEAPAAVCEEKV